MIEFVLDPSSIKEEGVILEKRPMVWPEGERAVLALGHHATLRSHSVIYGGTSIGNYFSTGHGALIRERVRIGDFVSIGSHSEVEPDVRIGNNVRIHSGCFIAEGTVIGDNVRLAPGVMVASDRHPWLPQEEKHRCGPRIEEGVYLSMGVIVLPSLTVGKRSVVGAGSVVTKDVPPNTLVFGNPARVVRKLE